MRKTLYPGCPEAATRVRREAGGISVDMAETRPAVACDEHLSGYEAHELAENPTLRELPISADPLGWIGQQKRV